MTGIFGIAEGVSAFLSRFPKLLTAYHRRNPTVKNVRLLDLRMDSKTAIENDINYRWLIAPCPARNSILCRWYCYACLLRAGFHSAKCDGESIE